MEAGYSANFLVRGELEDSSEVESEHGGCSGEHPDEDSWGRSASPVAGHDGGNEECCGGAGGAEDDEDLEIINGLPHDNHGNDAGEDHGESGCETKFFAGGLRPDETLVDVTNGT